MSATNPHEYRSCTVKVKHPTPAAALMVAQAVSRQRGEHVFAYECRYCGGYHVGHSPWQVRKFIAELVRSEEFSPARNWTVRPLHAGRIFEPMQVH